MARPRQVRGRFTGGEQEVQQFLQLLATAAEQEGWALTYTSEVEPFGDHGPLRRLTFGFTEG